MGLCIINGAKTLTPPQVVSNEVLSRHTLYGVSFNGTSSKGRPLYNAIDQKWIAATITDPGVDTWKNLAPFNVRKCITDYDSREPSKRKVLAYEGDENYDALKTGKTGDRMVEFPMGYYYRPDPWTFIVSPDPIEGFYPSPACDLGDGNILRGFRLSEFDLCNVSSVPRSIPGYNPWSTDYTGYQTFKNNLKSKGQYLETFGAWCWINFLRLIKQQNLNSQKINGMGIYYPNDRTRTMTEDNIQGLDGCVSLTANDNVRTLGLQNFYGHVWNFLHNVMVSSDSKVWIKKDFTNADSFPTFSNAIPNGWKELSVFLSSENGYVTELAWNFNESWALYPYKGGNALDPIGNRYHNQNGDPAVVVSYGFDDNDVGALSWSSGGQVYGEPMMFGGRSLEVIL